MQRLDTQAWYSPQLSVEQSGHGSATASCGAQTTFVAPPTGTAGRGRVARVAPERIAGEPHECVRDLFLVAAVLGHHPVDVVPAHAAVGLRRALLQRPCATRNMSHHRTMLQLAIRSVHPDEVDNLRHWFTQLQTARRQEVVASLIDETVNQETAVLIPNNGNPILVYAMEVEDPIQSKASANSGKHPIDAQHRAVMEAAISGTPDHETLLDVST